jgi:type VI secretion system VasD/TssJ family lipoprotein
MQPHSFVGKALRVLAGSAVAVPLVGLLGCAHAPKGSSSGPGVSLRLTASPRLNNCGRATAYPLHYKVIQVTDPLPLAGMTVERLWDHEAEMLGGAMLGKGPEQVIEPGKVRTDPLTVDPNAKALVVVGNFCRTTGSCFYYVQNVNQGGKKKGKKAISLDLTADSTCFSPTPH